MFNIKIDIENSLYKNQDELEAETTRIINKVSKVVDLNVPRQMVKLAVASTRDQALVYQRLEETGKVVSETMELAQRMENFGKVFSTLDDSKFTSEHIERLVVIFESAAQKLERASAGRGAIADFTVFDLSNTIELPDVLRGPLGRYMTSASMFEEFGKKPITSWTEAEEMFVGIERAYKALVEFEIAIVAIANEISQS